MTDLVLNADDIRSCVNEFLNEVKLLVIPNSWEDHFAFTAYNLARQEIDFDEFDRRMTSSWEEAYARKMRELAADIEEQREEVLRQERQLLDTMTSFPPFSDWDPTLGSYRPVFPHPQESILLRNLLRQVDGLKGGYEAFLKGGYEAFASAALNKRPPSQFLPIIYGELRKAVCEKDERYQAVLQAAGTNVKVLIGTIAGYLAHEISVPVAALAAVCGAVLLIASRVGREAFCSFAKARGACRPPTPAIPTPVRPLPVAPTGPRLVVLRGAHPNLVYPLAEGRTGIGRGPQGPGGINLEDQEAPDRVKASPQHAEVIVEGEELFLIDLGSNNGSFVNRQRIGSGERHEIKSGDMIQIGDVQMRVVV